MKPNHWIIALVLVALTVQAAPGADIVLPDPLLALDGTRIADGADWLTRRRPELLEVFSREVYGRAPIDRPDGLTFTVTNRKDGVMGGAADLRQVRIAWKGPHGTGGMDLVLFVPAKRTGPAPCTLLICNRNRATIDPERAKKAEYWPAEEIIARGYAAAAFYNGDLAPDKKDSFQEGVGGTFDAVESPRPGDAWATIAAWAWGARRAVDYLITDPGVDAGRLIVVGQSRGGKTALWAGAQDPRIAMTVSNCSGCTGAAASRGKGGQTIKQINAEFPFWFDGNYKNWNGKEWEAPFDQHEVLALCAPRLVYVASASADAGADPAAEFRSCVHASPVWGLWHRTGIATPTMPAADTPIHGGSIGYHMRSGEHDLKLYDWQRFLDFADQHLTPDNATNVVSVTATTPASSAGGAASAVTISRSGSTLTSLTVALAVGGTATAGTDYVALPRSVVIPAGSSSAALAITAKADAPAVPQKTVIVALPLDPGYALGSPAAATVTLSVPAK